MSGKQKATEELSVSDELSIFYLSDSTDIITLEEVEDLINISVNQTAFASSPNNN